LLWSPDGALLYFLSEREGFRCILAQRLDPATKRLLGEAFPVRHFHTARRSLMTIGDPGTMGMSPGFPSHNRAASDGRRGKRTRSLMLRFARLGAQQHSGLHSRLSRRQ
jgi:hypothetical protein